MDDDKERKRKDLHRDVQMVDLQVMTTVMSLMATVEHSIVHSAAGCLSWDRSPCDQYTATPKTVLQRHHGGFIVVEWDSTSMLSASMTRWIPIPTDPVRLCRADQKEEDLLLIFGSTTVVIATAVSTRSRRLTSLHQLLQ
jgi:hypothetical protein